MNWTECLAKVWNLGNAKLQTRNCSLRFAVCLMLKVSNNLAPPSKGELTPKAPYFFFFNLIAFLISIETEALLLALDKSIY